MINRKYISKKIKKATVVLLGIAALEVSLFSTGVNATESIPAVPTVPAAQTLPVNEVPSAGVTQDALTTANDIALDQIPSTVNVVNGQIEAMFEEDKEAVVEETTKRVTPKWQSQRKSAAKEHDYYIKVNKKTNTVTVYKKEENGKLTPYKAMVCSVGREGHDTPEGKGYKTTDYYDWRLMVDNTYGRYAVRFNGSIMFHSVPYYKSKKDSLEWQDYNKLGGPASLGCIRLAVADAKWIYDNCRRGTEVDVYSGPASTDPLGTPEPIRLDTTSKDRGWDPTDLTPENPWLVPIE